MHARVLLFELVVLVATASLATSCSSSSPASGPDIIVTQPIDAEGGTIEVGGAVFTFPSGALGGKTTIRISASAAGTVPSEYVGLSQLFRCEPAVTSFAKPLEVRIPFDDDDAEANATLFWSNGEGPGFDEVAGRVEGNTMIASVQHFSSGFVGRRK